MFPRYAKQAIDVALQDTRVVLVTGPRQVGKTTLVRELSTSGRTFLSFDEPGVYEAARRDVVQFVRGMQRVALDEVQRVPEVLLEIKRSVDSDTRPGRFLLTGSANVMALPTVVDSLAGRVELVSLWPLAQAEMFGRPSTFLERAFEGKLPELEACVLGDELVARVLDGGYPEALQRQPGARRQRWFLDYARTLLARDVRDIADVEHLSLLPRLLKVLANFSAQLINYTQVGALLQLNHKTTRRYVDIIELLYLVRSLPAWSNNRLNRLVKTPKLHFLDAGLLAAMQGITLEKVKADRQRFGAILETFVFGEVVKLIGWAEVPVDVFHFRDKDGAHEVDIVLEHSNGAVVGLEVKAAATVTAKDFRGLEQLRSTCGDRFALGMVLHDGPTVIPFGDRLFAAPLACLWH